MLLLTSILIKYLFFQLLSKNMKIESKQLCYIGSAMEIRSSYKVFNQFFTYLNDKNNKILLIIYLLHYFCCAD